MAAVNSHDSKTKERRPGLFAASFYAVADGERTTVEAALSYPGGNISWNWTRFPVVSMWSRRARHSWCLE